MMPSKLISIICGIFNVESFLSNKKLSCIINQTYTHWELILVDDGSTDGSGKICDEFARNDDRIKVVHKENGGLGSARNAGLDIAQGDYIWFYDVDDEAHLNLLEYCIREMESRDLEMLQFGFKAITPSQNLEEDVYLCECIIEDQNQLRSHYLDNILLVRNGNGFAWNKFYRRSFLDKYHLRFDDLRIQQDEVFNLRCYPYVERLYLSTEVLYDYYIYDVGNNRSRFIPDRFDIYVSIRDQFEKLRDTWSILDPRFDNYLQKRFFQSVDQTLRFNLLHPDCPWNHKKKNAEMNRVMEHPYTQKAITWAGTNVKDVEGRLYLYAFQQRNLRLLIAFASLLKGLRRLKHCLMKS